MNINELETVVNNLRDKNKPYLDNCRECSAIYRDRKKSNLFPVAAAFLGGYMVRKQGALAFLFGLSVRKKIMAFINQEADHYFSSSKFKPRYRNQEVSRETVHEPGVTSSLTADRKPLQPAVH